MRLYLDLSEIIDPQILTQPRIVADLEIPREFHSQAGLDVHALADFCAKQTQ